MEIRKHRNLDIGNHTYFHARFEVWNESLLLAKTTIFRNPFHKIDGQHACAIGHFECCDDQEVFKNLMDAVVEEVKGLGSSYIIGPLDGSTWDTYRLVTASNRQAFFLDVETPEYYLRLFEDFGFTRLAEYKSTLAEELVEHWDKVSHVYDRLVELGVVFRAFMKDEAPTEFRKVSDLCLLAFQNNFLFSPISSEEFIDKMMPALAFMHPKATVVAELDDKIVGFIFSYPDLNDKSAKTIVIKTLARDPSMKFQGIGSVLSSLAMKYAKEDGFVKGIHALMVNSNTSTYISKKFKAKTMRAYALMSLEID